MRLATGQPGTLPASTSSMNFLNLRPSSKLPDTPSSMSQPSPWSPYVKSILPSRLVASLAQSFWASIVFSSFCPFVLVRQ